MCEWKSCKTTLSSALKGFHLAYSPTASVSFADGLFTLTDSFLSDVGFPQANSCAQVLDEHLRLYEGRVADIRGVILPAYQERLRAVLGHGSAVELKLELDSFSRLDWEGDNYYNAYTELTPVNAEDFFGRFVRALEDLCMHAYDQRKLAAALTSIKIKLTITGEKQLAFRNGCLKVAERFWHGPEHSKSDIKDHLVKALHLGFDVQAWMDELENAVVPFWEDKISDLLQRKSDGRVHISFDWPSFHLAPAAGADGGGAGAPGAQAGAAHSNDLLSAVETVYLRRSEYCLERVYEAVQEAIALSSSALEKLSSRLAGISVRCIPLAPPHGGATVSAVPPPGAEAPVDGAPAPALAPLVLDIAAPWGGGVDLAPPLALLVENLVQLFDLEDEDVFEITYIKQTAERAEVHGTISSFDKFTTVFRMLEDYQKRAQSGFAPAPAGERLVLPEPPSPPEPVRLLGYRSPQKSTGAPTRLSASHAGSPIRTIPIAPSASAVMPPQNGYGPNAPGPGYVVRQAASAVVPPPSHAAAPWSSRPPPPQQQQAYRGQQFPPYQQQQQQQQPPPPPPPQQQRYGAPPPYW